MELSYARPLFREVSLHHAEISLSLGIALPKRGEFLLHLRHALRVQDRSGTHLRVTLDVSRLRGVGAILGGSRCLSIIASPEQGLVGRSVWGQTTTRWLAMARCCTAYSRTTGGGR